MQFTDRPAGDHAGRAGKAGRADWLTDCLFAVIKRDQLVTANKLQTHEHDGLQLLNDRWARLLSAGPSVSLSP